ncbi:NAD(P)/FAD-dependent oxidoreductase [Kosmotoga pacifica]|uniref:FAD-dependent oxidoreductase n=1 Tax=Kosmotoga pacifica TaxID=1330330 RepID=A0A0G2Z7A6_9BACT|nr:FAD-binding oxidoreductase [Kosmotoga pacifica]AKI97470.1 FAD-dependent oxidoreductase [Kosmotoga pacifica]
MKTEASVVIIGGGIVGTAIAFHLCKEGLKDVVLVEKSYLSSGATGRCGGGIRQQWSERMNVRLAMRSVKLFERFHEDVGMDIEYYQGGYLLLAYTDEEVELFHKNVAMQQEEGLNVRILSKEETARKFPFMNLAGLKLATFCPTDGHANPHLATMAYAKAAEKMGATILARTEVTDIDVQNGQIVGIQTTKGYIKTSVVVNATGGFSREVGLMAGVELPTESYRHQIFVTEPLEHILDPLVISFTNNFYIRQTKSGNFVMGQGDKDEPPSHKHDPSWKFLVEMTTKMPKFFPFLKNVRVLRHWAGLYNMSPDAQPIIDKAESVSDFYFAVGFSGHGFMLAPAVGEAIAEWIVHGHPKKVDISNLKLERFSKGVSKEKNVV